MVKNVSEAVSEAVSDAEWKAVLESADCPYISHHSTPFLALDIVTNIIKE
jgi:hypothetical protein